MATSLLGFRVAILATDGFEQIELFEPKRALEKASAQVRIVSNKSGSIRGWNRTDWGKKADVDVHLEDAAVEAFDALMLPGGVLNPDKLRMDSRAIEFIKEFFERGKPVAAICHGPQLLIEADVLHGRTMTSWPSLKTDLRNAGANWVDEEVVVDDGLVTSRKPEDLPAFNVKMIEEFSGSRRGVKSRPAHLTRESRLH